MNIKKNDVIEVEITAISSSGQGLGRYENLVIFVPYSAAGDVLSVRILKVKSSYAYGKIEKILHPSPDRTEMNSLDCDIFFKCGGCDFRHINYEAELKAKSEFIRDAFSKIAGLAPEFLPIIKNESISGYRNKVQFPVGKDGENNPIYGFYRTNSHDIIGCKNCLLQPRLFCEIADFIMGFIKAAKISVYSEAEHKGVLRHIYIRKGHYTDEICLTLIARRKVPEFLSLAKAARAAFPQIKSVVLNINNEKTNVILGGADEQVLDGVAVITDKMCGLEFEISPKSFYQINTSVAERLYKAAADFIQPEGKNILDLYSGIGAIGLAMSKTANEIICIEIVKEAVENARRNAARNNIKNVEFINADAEQGVEQLLKSGKKIDAVLLDPSRKGCEGRTVERITELKPERIVMISCNPATAARDCKKFAAYGYKTEKVQGADLFSRTKHVECVILMSRK